MKNQNDLIVIGVCVVFAIGGALTLFFTKREPVALAAPSSVLTTDPKFADNTAPVMGDSLPGGGSGSFGGGFGGGFAGGPGGMMGGGSGQLDAAGIAAKKKMMGAMSMGK